MPHSSGGGSHGGGSHSSSHSSSRSYSSSSSSSYSSGPVEKRYSARPYPGASRYVYYDRRGHYHNVYHEGFVESVSISDAIIVTAVIAMIALPIIICLLVVGINVPHKINIEKYDHQITVEDSLGIIDKAVVEKSLKNFQDTTGVTACVKVVSEIETQDYYDLETYAYSEYLRMFNDEYHWLIVLEMPEEYKDATFVSWEWEGMIGDDCDRAISYDAEDDFTWIMHSHLLRSEVGTTSKEIAAAFDEFSAIVMTPTYNWWLIGMAGVVVVIAGLLIAYTFNGYYTHKRMERAYKVAMNAKEATCKYCGCAYVVGTVSVCQHCGAAISAHKEQVV